MQSTAESIPALNRLATLTNGQLASVTLGRLSLNVAYRIIYPLQPFLAQHLHVNLGTVSALVTVQVQTGATDGRFTEIISCLNTGTQCLRPGDRVALELPSSTGNAGGPGSGDMVFTSSGPGGAVGPPPGGGKGPVQIFVGP